jgi:hypothetical protein
VLLKVTPEKLGEVWGKAYEWLAPAIERDGLVTKETVYDGLKSGYNQLWVCETAAAVTCLEDYAKERVCFIWLAGGSDLSKIKENMRFIEAWAFENGCSRMRVTGRKGWLRVFKDYSEPYITMEKKI